MGYRQWQAYIQGTYRATGYTVNDQEDSFVWAEISDVDCHGAFQVRNAQGKNSTGSWWKFNMYRWQENTAGEYTIVDQNGHMWDWNVTF